MRYFVIGVNGELYGPADIPTLNQWITEGRLLPTSMLQEELGGARFAASLLAGLNFPGAEGTAYPRHYPGMAVDQGANDVKTAWILGAVGLLCCSFCAPIGIFYGLQGKKKGHPGAIGAIVFCCIVTVLSILTTIALYSMGGLRGLTLGY